MTSTLYGQLPRAFRPISLISVIGKTFERMIAERLIEELDVKLNDNQHGFRRGKSTDTALKSLMLQIDNSNSKHVTAISLDIKGAFDGVWWPAVISGLRRLEASNKLTNIIASYLSERSQIVDCGNEIIQRASTRGCPQGSVLGPLLWIIVFDELLTQNFPIGVSIISYADDAILIIESPSRIQTEEKFSRSAEIINCWARKVKLEFAPEKTQAICFKGKLQGRDPILTLNNHRIPFVDSIKHLGVTIDKRRLFVEHVESAGEKAAATFNNVTRLAKLKYGVMPTTYDVLYRSVYIPIVAYALLIWIHKIDNLFIARALRASQRSILRCILGAYRTVSLPALCVISGNYPITIMLKRRAALMKRKLGEELRTKEEIEASSIVAWQECWRDSGSGRFTYELKPDVRIRKDFPKHLEPDHILTQLYSGHGAFRSYLHRMNKAPSPDCPMCEVEDSPAHALLHCPKWALEEPRLNLMRKSQELGIAWPADYEVLFNEEMIHEAKKLMKIIAHQNRAISRDELMND